MFSLTVSLILLSRAFWYWHRAWYWGGATISPWKPFLARFQMISPIICCDVQGRVTFLFKCNCMWYTQIQWYQRSCRDGNQKNANTLKTGKKEDSFIFDENSIKRQNDKHFCLLLSCHTERSWGPFYLNTICRTRARMASTLQISVSENIRNIQDPAQS